MKERGEHRSKRCYPLFLLALLLPFLSCKENSKREYPWEVEENAYVDEDTTVFSIEETGGDTLLVGSVSYHDAAERAERMLNELQAVKSPDMLLAAMTAYDIYKKETTNVLNLPQERERLAKLQDEVDRAYSQACRDYMLPARGVLQTIQLVQQRLHNCHTSAEFNRLRDVRYAYFQSLPQLHRIVIEPNKRRVVHQQALELQKLLDSKQAEFSK